jgi:hypothetical protein
MPPKPSGADWSGIDRVPRLDPEHITRLALLRLEKASRDAISDVVERSWVSGSLWPTPPLLHGQQGSLRWLLEGVLPTLIDHRRPTMTQIYVEEITATRPSTQSTEQPASSGLLR